MNNFNLPKPEIHFPKLEALKSLESLKVRASEIDASWCVFSRLAASSWAAAIGLGCWGAHALTVRAAAGRAVTEQQKVTIVRIATPV